MVLNILIGLFVFILGLCIGSFLNCMIYRQEQEKTLEGRSFCPHCKHTLLWNDLFPVFSFVFLKGKCRYCNKKISWQYPLVEISTGLIFLLILNYQFSIFNQFDIFQFLNIIFLFYVFSALIVIFVYDLKHYIIPDNILFPAIFISLIYKLILSHNIQNIINIALAIAIASGFFLLIFLFSKGKAMGFGDVKLAILMGILLGFPNVLVALFLAFLFGAIIGLILIFFDGKGMKSQIPFGPFLIFGTVISLFYAEIIIKWYFSLIF